MVFSIIYFYLFLSSSKLICILSYVIKMSRLSSYVDLHMHDLYFIIVPLLLLPHRHGNTHVCLQNVYYILLLVLLYDYFFIE